MWEYAISDSTASKFYDRYLHIAGGAERDILCLNADAQDPKDLLCCIFLVLAGLYVSSFSCFCV